MSALDWLRDILDRPDRPRESVMANPPMGKYEVTISYTSPDGVRTTAHYPQVFVHLDDVMLVEHTYDVDVPVIRSVPVERFSRPDRVDLRLLLTGEVVDGKHTVTVGPAPDEEEET